MLQTVLILLSVHILASSLASLVTSFEASAISLEQAMRSLLEPVSPLCKTKQSFTIKISNRCKIQENNIGFIQKLANAQLFSINNLFTNSQLCLDDSHSIIIWLLFIEFITVIMSISQIILNNLFKN